MFSKRRASATQVDNSLLNRRFREASRRESLRSEHQNGATAMAVRQQRAMAAERSPPHRAHHAAHVLDQRQRAL